MTETPSSADTRKGLWTFGESGDHLEFKTEEQLARDSRPLNHDTMTPEGPSDKAVAEYLANLSPVWQRQRDNLRALGWKDESIQNFLSVLQDSRKLKFARMRMAGTSEDEIERLNTLCDDGITDYSYMKRPLATPADEDYEVQLYLLKEEGRLRDVLGTTQ
ncbi:hypothetical protein N7492_004721 [Penicillium capsulatum]|uniref:Uncharacterized protein n=1 Tax=Penicillium capsulatum TaxID=69766 RepID=A0A9W9IAL0_9EURO|nr:hypothetical protein N7492_004721 [Penicillium capsulatum]KAJ6136174.1 hypothetical protein N7512_001334 [Penicillium capsulatum]